MAKELWQTIVLKPLTGMLDTRSRPADVPVGGFRWKQNFAVNTEGKLYRRGGWSRFFSEFESEDPEAVPNHDYHNQGAGEREAITTLFESTDNAGERRLFCASQSRVSVLNETTGDWTDILDGMGADGSRWSMAELNNIVVLTNDVDPVQYHDIGSGTAQAIAELGALNVTKARVAISYNGFVILMNIEQDGERYTSRIRWCDLNDPTAWDPSTADTLARFQDLDYGDDILNAAVLLGNIYIYTRRSIWKCSVNPQSSAESVFVFTRVYHEPKNQAGCLVYPYTLVSTGNEHYYASRESIYKFTPYRPEPERTDWLHRASGAIFESTSTKLDGTFSDAPVAEFRPATKEMWFSWPSSGRGRNNNHSEVFHVEQSTADYVDHGFTAFCNYRRNGATGGNEVQDFLGASSRDWCIKDIDDTVLSREYYDPDTGLYATEGYFSILRGTIPLGLSDREKRLRLVVVDHDTTTEDDPCVIRLRVGNSYHLSDPNNTGETCPIVWRQHENRALSCPDSATLAQYTSQNLRPNEGTDWAVFEQGRFLYYEFKIANSDNSAAIGGDTYWDRIEFEAMAMPK